MKYLRNPVSGEVQQTTPLMGKRLARYGWTYVTSKDWLDYRQAQLRLAMIKNMPSQRHKLGSLH